MSDKIKTYSTGRKCSVCGHSISIYNNLRLCFSCQDKENFKKIDKSDYEARRKEIAQRYYENKLVEGYSAKNCVVYDLAGNKIEAPHDFGKLGICKRCGYIPYEETKQRKGDWSGYSKWLNGEREND